MNIIKNGDASQFVLDSLQEYGQYTNEHRSIPSIMDALKPSQRKILYGAYLLKLKDEGKYKKVTNLVGQVVPFYQHGAASLEGAIVKLGQSFRTTYPLLDIQGNKGGQSLLDSPNCGAAASRYIETRLTGIGMELLKSIKDGTAKMVSTYDGTMMEPEHLFIPIPLFLLLNQKGIGVGTATSIPSFEINSVIELTEKLINNPDLGFEEIARVLKPFYRQQATVINASELPSIYAHKPRDNNKRSIKFRASFKVAGSKLIVTNFPYDAAPSIVARQIESKLDKVDSFKTIKRIQDTTVLNDKAEEVVSMEINLKKASDVETLIEDLCQHTSLESYVAVNLVLLDKDNKVKEYNIKEAMLDWIEIYKEKTEIKLQKEKGKLEEQKEKIEGLVRALDEIDVVIELIKSSETKGAAEVKLIKKGYSKLQASAILDMKLSKLANMEYKSLLKELEELKKSIAEIEKLLNSETALRQYLIEVTKSYKMDHPLGECKLENSLRVKVKKVKDENVYVEIKPGYAKITDTIPKSKNYIVGNKKDPVYLLNENFVTPIYNTKETVIKNPFGVVVGDDPIVHIDKFGHAKLTAAKDVRATRRAKITKQEEVVMATQANLEDYVVLTSVKGKKLQFQVSDIPFSGRNALGVKGAKLDEGDFILSAKIVKKPVKGVKIGRNNKMS